MDIENFFREQLDSWDLARENYDLLKSSVVRREVDGGRRRWTLQCNPSRRRSTGAKLDAATLASRPCFLCRGNRPAEQMAIESGDFEILVNPYPIFERHLTIVAKEHRPQRLGGKIGEMIDFACRLEGFTVFYNGSRCGASAPDHLHFQAAPTGEFPIWETIEHTAPVWREGRLSVYDAEPTVVAAEGSDAMSVERALRRALNRLEYDRESGEPMINLLISKQGDRIRAVVIPRSAHRPRCYGEGAGEMLVSPASVDLAGVMIMPDKDDFERIDQQQLLGIVEDVTYPAEKIVEHLSRRVISVGVMSGREITVTLTGAFLLDGEPVGDCRLTFDRKEFGVDDERRLEPLSEASTFTLNDVTIGIGFHWQQQQDQTFSGGLRLVADGDKLQAINDVDLEDYLLSVISSEMNAQAPEEFLKAHAVISRSWALAQIDPPTKLATEGCRRDDGERIVWYDHTSHTLFDVCADDHCQRYQGATKATTPAVRHAIESTRGEVLTYEGELCDARFSKCCGGVTEQFSACWQPVDMAYLPSITDDAAESPADLSTEAAAEKWILSHQDAFCSDPSAEVLSCVLNNYDRSTPHLYRWTVEYTAEELKEIVSSRSGIDFGYIISLQPLHRGRSGRIDRLRVCGTRRTIVVGKELEIRRWLSTSHLYSSAFVVEAGEIDEAGVPKRWTLRGAGWGHGVGLCQIGAAVMATKGYDYKQILSHYFPGAEISR